MGTAAAKLPVFMRRTFMAIMGVPPSGSSCKIGYSVPNGYKIQVIRRSNEKVLDRDGPSIYD